MGRAKKDVMRKDIRKMVKNAMSDNTRCKDSNTSCGKSGLADLIRNKKS